MSFSIEDLIIIFAIFHIFAGLTQFIYYPIVKRDVDNQIFPDKSYFVSVIVPVKDNSPSLRKNLETLCTQDYPHYEVVFVSEKEDDTGGKVAKTLAEHFVKSGRSTAKRIRYVVAGPLPSREMIAKSHNLLKGIEVSEGEVLLFTDSDVSHPKVWIREMVNPLGEVLRGKRISATTAVFFIDPEGFLGIFSSLSSNAATWVASFTGRRQDLPAYASGASMAVFREAFMKAEVAERWKHSLNDDLVMAAALIDAGYHIFNVRHLPTRPMERFDNIKGMNNKMVRWMLTVKHYTHPRFRKEVVLLGFRNLQFQTMVNVAIILYFLKLSGYLHLNMWVLVYLILITYIYNVLARFAIAKIINERNVYPYLWLSPISQYFWGFYFLISSLFIKEFQWGGRRYRL